MHAGIRIFDPMLFNDTAVSKIMEDFNTKCYVMNNEDKLFQLKTILGNFVFINEENKSKEIQGKNVLSFTKFVLGVFVRGVLGLGDFCRGVYVRGFFVLSPFFLGAVFKILIIAQEDTDDLKTDSDHDEDDIL